MCKNRPLRFIVYILFFCFFSILMLNGCTIKPNKNEFITKEDLSEEISDIKTRNLQKLCKVWGYTKYTHPVFLLGQKDWDEELLNLIPIISSANSEEKANAILYDWFISLGEINYGTTSRLVEWKYVKEEDILIQADTSWIKDEAYLGKELSSALSALGEIPAVSRSKAPVFFDSFPEAALSLSNFKNEKIYDDMDYSDTNYRLLGLFRFWNAVEYYFPYKDIMDYDWNELLIEFIPEMLKGTDKQSYELTLAAIGAKLNDAHVYFTDNTFLRNQFGFYSAPVSITKAEGHFAVLNVYKAYQDLCPLKPGDILLQLNGIDIKDKAEEIKKYKSYTEDTKLLATIAPYILRSHEKTMEVTVLRDREELTLTVEGTDIYLHPSMEFTKSYEILENNIGLINPAILEKGEIHQIMAALADTNGLIVDFRQYPSDFLTYSLGEYFIDRRMPFVLATQPSKAVPGTFIYSLPLYSGRVDRSSGFYYENKVVLLMSENTWSQPEFTIMSLRNGPNVTVMGENSIGADGNVTDLPLPGGNHVLFTGLGVYTPDGGQTQRTGLSPDIYVERTLKGIKEGRDEFIEAAVEYISNNK